MEITAYHGSDTEFDTFDNEYMGKHTAIIGYGFFFTTDIEIAKNYGRIIYKCGLNIQKVLHNNKKTITKPLMNKILNALDKNTDNEFMYNYGDINREGYNVVFNRAMEDIYENSNSDVMIFNTLSSIQGDDDIIAKTFLQFGYNAIVDNNPQIGVNNTYSIIIMLDGKDVQILDKQYILEESYKARAIFV